MNTHYSTLLKKILLLIAVVNFFFPVIPGGGGLESACAQVMPGSLETLINANTSEASSKFLALNKKIFSITVIVLIIGTCVASIVLGLMGKSNLVINVLLASLVLFGMVWIFSLFAGELQQ